MLKVIRVVLITDFLKVFTSLEYLGFCFAAKANFGNGENGDNSQRGSRWCVRLYDPEGHPGANDNKREGKVDAKQEEATLPLKVQREEGDRVVPEPACQLPIGQTSGHPMVKLLQGHF